MADDFSFDVVSKVDLHAVEDAVNVASKEIAARYDFKDTNSSITLDAKNLTLTLVSSDDFRIKSLYDVLLTRLSKRGLPLRNFSPEKAESSLGGTMTQVVKIQQGIPADKCKEIARAVKDSKLKATASIQGDHLRVTSRSKDVLQSVITLLKSGNYGVELHFENYR
ncbi:MAG: YajQ family cyclic di-GMP-binding protein [Elusimicrobia bacterium]|nr:YajQ family cyclic di-GMP-binding protein [Elusimicrobiota bacterium]